LEGISNTGVLETFVETTNICIGDSTTGANMGGSAEQNICIGRGAGNAIVDKSYVICIGENAGNLLTDNYNVLIGTSAGSKLTNVSGSTMVGWEAGKNSTGANNTYFGYNAGESSASSTGGLNTAMGYNCCSVLTSGNHNTLFGALTGNSITSGTGNVFLGYNAGEAQSTGSNCICIGKDSDVSTGTSNSICIGQGVTTLLSNECLIGNSSCTFVGPGADNTMDSGASGHRWTDIWYTGSIQTSDGRTKDIDPLYEFGLKDLLKIKPISFKWKDREIDDMLNPGKKIMKTYKRKHLGFDANQLGQMIDGGDMVDTGIFVRATGSDGNEITAYRPNEMLSLAVKAIQDLKTELNDLSVENKRLELLISQLSDYVGFKP